jgi:hypothetical protein
MVSLIILGIPFVGTYWVAKEGLHWRYFGRAGWSERSRQISTSRALGICPGQFSGRRDRSSRPPKPSSSVSLGSCG